MSNIAFVIFCLLLGLLLRHLKQFKPDASLALNQYIICVALPAIVLVQIPLLEWNWQVLLPGVVPWLLLVISALLVLALSKWLAFSKPVTGALLILVPLGNTSFLGFPLVSALLGQSALPFAILYDQLGGFLALSSYGFVVLAYYTGQSVSVAGIANKVLKFPPFIALLAALLVSLLGVSYPLFIEDSLLKIGATLVPVVMVSVGLQWQLKTSKSDLRALSFGLVIKLLLLPFITLVSFWLLGNHSLMAKTIILEAGMSPMISAGALLIAHNIAPKFVASMIGYGVMISLVTVPFWAYVISLVL